MSGPVISRRAVLASTALPLVLPGCGGAGLDQLAPGPSGKVVDVKSGDSVVLDSGQVVRLVGLEAPRAGQVYAEESRLALAELVAGQPVQLLFGGARQDAYGRALAHVRLQKGRVWVQQALLEGGSVRVRTYPDNRALVRPMLDAEARARRDKRGLWTLLAYRVRLPREAAADPFGFQIVEGRVSTVQGADFGQVLDLEHWIRVEVPRGAQAAAISMSELTGKLVRVRADVRRGDSEATMRLDHPEQLERLREA